MSATILKDKPWFTFEIRMRHNDDSKPTNRPAKGVMQDGPYSGFRRHLCEFFYRYQQ
jgi:hypothetical protein